MKKYGIIGIVFVGVAVICAFTFRGHKEADYLLTDFPAEADPVTVGNKIADRFLEQWHSQYGSPLRVDEPRTQITYPDVCTWLGGLWFAQATKTEAWRNAWKRASNLSSRQRLICNRKPIMWIIMCLVLFLWNYICRLKMKSIWQWV